MREGRRCSELLQEARHRFAPFALFEAIAAKFSPNPLVQTVEFKPASREAVVGKPPHEEQVEFDDHLRKANAPVAAGNLPDFLLRACKALGRDPEFAV